MLIVEPNESNDAAEIIDVGSPGSVSHDVSSHVLQDLTEALAWVDFLLAGIDYSPGLGIIWFRFSWYKPGRTLGMFLFAHCEPRTSTSVQCLYRAQVLQEFKSSYRLGIVL